MKRFFYFLVLVLFVGSLNSCASKRKGCGLTADNTQIDLQSEVAVAEAE
jgi:hypothetical protein